MLRANHLVIQEKSKEKVVLIEFYFQVWPFCICIDRASKLAERFRRL